MPGNSRNPEVGVVWLRRTLEIPANWAGHDLQLDLGQIKDFDDTYFNGVKVGLHPKGTPSAASLNRSYIIPASLVKAGRAVIAVRVFDQNGGGGLSGPAPRMALACSDKPDTPRCTSPAPGALILRPPSLSPPSTGAANPGPIFRRPSTGLPSLYNGMISPLAATVSAAQSGIRARPTLTASPRPTPPASNPSSATGVHAGARATSTSTTSNCPTSTPTRAGPSSAKARPPL